MPAGLTWGYGVEKVRGRPEAARRSAYLKAVDDLLSHGPLVVSRTVRASTSVVDARSVNRTMESTFRLRASNIIQPSFLRAGVEDGFSWALVGTSERDIERGWEEFLSWREGKISEALTLFEEATGRGRLGLLQASMSIFEDVGAQDDPDLAYYRVKTALDTELSRLAELEAMKKRVLDAVVAGRLTEANRSLDIALRTGLEPPAYESLKYRIEDQRARAISIVVAGDSLYYNGRYKEALRRYEEAERLNVDHPVSLGSWPPRRLRIARRVLKPRCGPWVSWVARSPACWESISSRKGRKNVTNSGKIAPMKIHKMSGNLSRPRCQTSLEPSRRNPGWATTSRRRRKKLKPPKRPIRSTRTRIPMRTMTGRKTRILSGQGWTNRLPPKPGRKWFDRS